MLARLKSITATQIIAIILIGVGLFIIWRYSLGAFRAYREIEFARQNNFAAGVPDVDLIRPWMNMEYIAVAYAVPQAFIYEELGIEMSRPNSNMPLFRLNDAYNFGTADDGYPAIVNAVQEAIRTYQENPVPTGLQEGDGRIAPWMSVEYIANSTGIPAEYIFEQIGVPMDDNAFVPIEYLLEEIDYPGDEEELLRDIQQAVESYEDAD